MNVFVIGLSLGLVLSWWIARQEQRNRRRDQARLQVLESQVAGMRAVLRIKAAEYRTRQRMRSLHSRSVYANPTIHEEPELWRRS